MTLDLKISDAKYIAGMEAVIKFALSFGIPQNVTIDYLIKEYNLKEVDAIAAYKDIANKN